ncbi:hypothetical protein BGY98DRAFT_481529 [Russula aff. rugulosa BPL654]|nr:hypothetical protein BGY98DRAFT_481529 [Russula aff. rugulosa BPL654]
MKSKRKIVRAPRLGKTMQIVLSRSQAFYPQLLAYSSLNSQKLSPDSGIQTVALLQQISHQLPNSPNSTYSTTANQPSSHGTAMIWVNALWLISLVLSLTTALIATLLLQWAHKYTQTPKYANTLRHRVRVRSLLLVGGKRYKVHLIAEILPTIVHLSVYLFLGGLVIAFHTINKTVAIAVDVAVGVSGLVYIALSILPCLDVACPYRTPISKILWYPCHALLSLAALCLRWCLLVLYMFLDQPVLSRGQRILLRWLQSRGYSIKNHWQFFSDGLEKSIVDCAVETLKDGDGVRITWLFNRLALGDKDKFLKFAASIPRHIIPILIPSTGPFFFPDFGASLLLLLRSCVAGRYTVGPDADVHEQSLLLCLHAIRHIVKANIEDSVHTIHRIFDLDFMKAHIANAGLMRSLWGDMDDSIRIASRSICALVAKQVIRKQWLDGADRSWLEEVNGESSNSILEADVTVWRDQLNFKSFVNGALPNHVPYRDLSAEDATSFNETLAILLGVRTNGLGYFTTRDWQTRLSEEVGRIQRYDPRGALEVFNALRLAFPSLPPATPAHTGVPPSHLIPTPSPVLPPPRGVLPPGPVLLPPMKFSLRPLLPPPREVPLLRAGPLSLHFPLLIQFPLAHLPSLVQFHLVQLPLPSPCILPSSCTTYQCRSITMCFIWTCSPMLSMISVPFFGYLVVFSPYVFFWNPSL